MGINSNILLLSLLCKVYPQHYMRGFADHASLESAHRRRYGLLVCVRPYALLTKMRRTVVSTGQLRKPQQISKLFSGNREFIGRLFHIHRQFSRVLVLRSALRCSLSRARLHKTCASEDRSLVNRKCTVRGVDEVSFAATTQIRIQTGRYVRNSVWLTKINYLFQVTPNFTRALLQVACMVWRLVYVG